MEINVQAAEDNMDRIWSEIIDEQQLIELRDISGGPSNGSSIRSTSVPLANDILSHQRPSTSIPSYVREVTEDDDQSDFQLYWEDIDSRHFAMAKRFNRVTQRHELS